MAKLSTSAPEPHLVEPFKPGNTIVGEEYEETNLISQGLFSVYTYIDYKNKKGELVEKYLLRVRYIENNTRLPNTSDLLNMKICKLQFYVDNSTFYDDAFINNMVKPVLNRKIKEAYKVHKSVTKCVVNPVLRKIQFWTNNPLVIASKITDAHEFVRYSVKRVSLIKSTEVNPRKEVYEYKFRGCWLKTFACILFGE